MDLLILHAAPPVCFNSIEIQTPCQSRVIHKQGYPVHKTPTDIKTEIKCKDDISGKNYKSKKCDKNVDKRFDADFKLDLKIVFTMSS